MDEDRGAFGEPDASRAAGPLETPGPERAGVEVLRDIAQSMAAVRQALEHGDRDGAVHAAQHLLRAVERLPATREEYERLCEEADRLLAADPQAWDPGRA